jgi:hypothetical protein
VSLKAPTLDVVLTPENYLEVADHFGLDVWLSSGGRIYLRIERAGVVIPAFLGDRIIHHYGANAFTEVISGPDREPITPLEDVFMFYTPALSWSPEGYSTRTRALLKAEEAYKRRTGYQSSETEKRDETP